MKFSKTFVIIIALTFFAYVPVQNSDAQPSPEELSEQIEQQNEDWLQNIDNLTVTTETADGGFIPSTTTTFTKVTEDGRTWLQADQDDTGIHSGVMYGAPEDDDNIHIRHASSITTETLDGNSVYKVIVDDSEVLSRSMETETDLSGEEPQKATYWIDQDELLMRKALIEQEDQYGDEIITEVRMEDYQYHEGFPIAHSVEMEIEGIENQISEAELREAREGLKEMRDQMDQLPQAQRSMMEDQFEEVFERFGAMLATGEVGVMNFEVTEVEVNQ